MKMTTKTLLISIALVIFAAAAFILISILQSRNLQNTSAQFEKSEKILLLMEKIQAQVSENIADVRGFVLTGNEKFLEPATAPEIKIDKELEELKNITAHPVSIPKIDSIGTYVHKNMEIRHQVIMLRKQGRVQEAID